MDPRLFWAKSIGADIGQHGDKSADKGGADGQGAGGGDAGSRCRIERRSRHLPASCPASNPTLESVHKASVAVQSRVRKHAFSHRRLEDRSRPWYVCRGSQSVSRPKREAKREEGAVGWRGPHPTTHGVASFGRCNSAVAPATSGEAGRSGVAQSRCEHCVGGAQCLGGESTDKGVVSVGPSGGALTSDVGELDAKM